MPVKTIYLERAWVGFSGDEFYLRLGDYILILPPAAAKRLRLELGEMPDNSVKEEHSKSARKAEPISKQVLKALFKSRKVTKSLIAVNTKRRRRLPDGQ